MFIQDTYLVNGELKKWADETSLVYSTISSTENNEPTLPGTITFIGEKEAMNAVDTADIVYNKLFRFASF